MKKVCAATVTELSAAAGDGTAGPAPTARQLLDKLMADHAHDTAGVEKFLSEMPRGFKMVPVLYTRIDSDKNARTQAEYSLNVRPRFFQFLAETQEQQLRDLGICDNGIARMKRGLDPATTDDKYYHISVDHIIERSGSGTLGTERCADPDRPADAKQTFPVNHFANLILLPEKVHLYKNKLNVLQNMGQVAPGQSKWLLIMVPESTPENPGYVCAAQAPGHPLAGLEMKYFDAQRRIKQAAFVTAQAGEMAYDLRNINLIANQVSVYIEIAQRQNTSVASLYGNERADKLRKAPTLRDAFNSVLAYDKSARIHINSRVRPAIQEMRAVLESTHRFLDHAVHNTKEPEARGHYDAFVKFFNGRNVREACFEASKLPLDESADLISACNRIDRAIRQRQSEADIKRRDQNRAQQAKHHAANNNVPQNKSGQKPHHNGQGPTPPKNTGGHNGGSKKGGKKKGGGHFKKAA